jgi:uncharacterized membrane protein
MPIYQYVTIYFASLICFLLVDFVWLGWVAKPFYHRQAGALLSPQVNWPAAIAFYLIYVIGLLVFCTLPALARGSLASAMGWGALYGFFTYATYELTNYALLKDWPAALVPVDIAWGVVLCSLVAAGGYWVGQWLMR